MLTMLKDVADFYNCDLEKAGKLNVYEFLNILSFVYFRRQEEEKMMRAEYAKMKSKYRH